METGSIVWIDVAKLVASRWATGGETGRWRGILQSWIERTGRYEPLVVRRCAGGGRKRGFEVIHGHGRLRVLRELGHRRVACIVWRMTDVEALFYLATLNKVRGREVARRRVGLLREIARRGLEKGNKEMRKKGNEGDEGVYEWMGPRLLETGPVLERVLGRKRQAVAAAPAVAGMREAFTVFLTADQKRRVVERLRKVDRDVGRALVRSLDAED